MDFNPWIETTDTHPEGDATSDRTTCRFMGIALGMLTRFGTAIEA